MSSTANASLPSRQSLWSEGDHPLSAKEQAAVDAAVQTGEEPQLMVRGRTDGKLHIWALTPQRLLVVGTGGWRPQTSVVAFNTIKAIEEQDGVHGTTVQLDLIGGGGRVFLVAVDANAARGFVLALGKAAGVEPVLYVPPAPPPSRVPVVIVPPQQESIVVSLERLAVLHAAGNLSDAEFANAKQKLLS